MQTSINLKFNNTYDVKLINSINGEVKQSGTFHNIVTENFMRMLMGSDRNNLSNLATTPITPAWNLRGILSCLAVGNGSTEPSYEDTSLAGYMWSTGPHTTEYEWLDDYTIRCTGKYSFPATEAYVGTISEAGLTARYRYYSSGNYYTGNDVNMLMTRSLFTDSEGQPISFTKTDIDILDISVTVEISMISTSENFTLYKKPYLLAWMAGAVGHDGTYTTFEYMCGIDLRRFTYDLENLTTSIDKEQGASSSYQASLTYDGSVGQVNVAQVRIGTGTITSERYYKAVALPFLGYWKLPNENVFPAYTISNLQIGVGDGTTTVFENPLNYFKANSDKLYKNGVLLTRDVDYTLSNIGNKDCLPEVSDFNYPVKVTSDLTGLEVFSSNSYKYGSFLRPSYALYKTPAQFDADTECFAFDANNPIYIEYEEAVILNCLKTNGVTVSKVTGGTTYPLPSGTVFYVDASQDGEVYENVGSYTTTSSGYNFAFDFEFTETTAKYWRIRTSYSSGSGTNADVIVLYGGNYYLTLNRKSPDIVLTEAPAEGDVITMDVEMDVIMKNSNFVLDIGCSINFSM